MERRKQEVLLSDKNAGYILLVPLQEEQGVLDVRQESSNFTILAAGVDKARGKLITRILKYLILDFPQKKYSYKSLGSPLSLTKSITID